MINLTSFGLEEGMKRNERLKENKEIVRKIDADREKKAEEEKEVLLMPSAAPPASGRASSRTNDESMSYSKPRTMFEIVKSGNLEDLIQAYLLQRDLTEKDLKGNNLLHCAAQTDQRYMCRALIVLTVNDCLWEEKNANGKKPIDLASNSKIRKDLEMIARKTPIQVEHHTSFNKSLIDEKIKNPNLNFKVMLSMDGGGIKALLEVAILTAIEQELGEPLMSRIHWLAGTSCGGIVSLGLGVGLSPNLLRRIFLAGRERVFCGNSKTYPKHNSSGIEDYLKSLLGNETPMSNINQKLIVTAARVDHAPPSLVLFRSFAPRLPIKEYERLGYLNPDRIKVWKAARCTSAAPVYFESFRGLADGAIFCNNPTITCITEFFRLKKIETHRGVPNNDELGCIISIGSGQEPVVPLAGGIDINLNTKMSIYDYKNVFGRGKNLITLFMYQCTSSHGVANSQAREWAHSLNVPFFRFSPKLIKAYELDTIKLDEMFDFCFETEVYIRTQVRHDIKDLARLLKQMPKQRPLPYPQAIRT